MCYTLYCGQLVHSNIFVETIVSVVFLLKTFFLNCWYGLTWVPSYYCLFLNLWRSSTVTPITSKNFSFLAGIFRSQRVMCGGNQLWQDLSNIFSQTKDKFVTQRNSRFITLPQILFSLCRIAILSHFLVSHVLTYLRFFIKR